MEAWAALSPLCCKAQEAKMHLSGQKWPGGCHCCEPEVTLAKSRLLRRICRVADERGLGVSLLRVLSLKALSEFIWRFILGLGGGDLLLFWGWQCCGGAGGFSGLSTSTDKSWYFLSAPMSTEPWFQWGEQKEGNFGCSHSIFTPSSLCCLGITLLLAERWEGMSVTAVHVPTGFCAALQFGVQLDAQQSCAGPYCIQQGCSWSKVPIPRFLGILLFSVSPGKGPSAQFVWNWRRSRNMFLFFSGIHEDVLGTSLPQTGFSVKLRFESPQQVTCNEACANLDWTQILKSEKFHIWGRHCRTLFNLAFFALVSRLSRREWTSALCCPC